MKVLLMPNRCHRSEGNLINIDIYLFLETSVFDDLGGSGFRFHTTCSRSMDLLWACTQGYRLAIFKTQELHLIC